MIKLAPTIAQTLSKCLSSIMPLYTFSTNNSQKLRRIGKYAVPDLPAYQIKTQGLRPVSSKQQQMSINDYHDLVGQYKKYRDLPQCKYFSFQYRNRVYHMFNAFHYPMGRMINQIATFIRGKHSPHFRNSQVNIKNGDVCVVVNIQDPLFTGKKLLYKNFKYHTGFVGHLRTHSYRSVLNKKPQLLYYYLLRKAMPKNKVSQQYMKNLKLYRGPTHDLPHIPQFAPSRFIQNPLTQIDFQKYVQEHPQQFKQIYKKKQEQVPVGTVLGEQLQQQKILKSQTNQQKQKSLQTDDKFQYNRKIQNAEQIQCQQNESFCQYTIENTKKIQTGSCSIQQETEI